MNDATHNQVHGGAHTVVQVRDVSCGIALTAPPWRPPLPRELPPAPPRFTNRTAELGELHALLDAPHQARLVVLVGVSGVGKTSIAAEFAHRVAHLFPDGQLRLSLAGGTDHPRRPVNCSPPRCAAWGSAEHSWPRIDHCFQIALRCPLACPPTSSAFP